MERCAGRRGCEGKGVHRGGCEQRGEQVVHVSETWSLCVNVGPGCVIGSQSEGGRGRLGGHECGYSVSVCMALSVTAR